MKLTGTLEKDLKTLKNILPAEDILTFSFQSKNGIDFTVVYADPISDKELLGEQVIRPLLRYDGKATAEDIGKSITSAELRKNGDIEVSQEYLP